MVKIQCCDVCYHVDHKLTQSAFNFGFKNSGLERVNVCQEHKKLFEGMTRGEYSQALADLYCGKIPTPHPKVIRQE